MWKRIKKIWKADTVADCLMLISFAIGIYFFIELTKCAL